MPKIRLATPHDLPQIVTLDQALFGWYGAAESPAVIRARLAIFPAGFVVLEDDEEFLGYASSEKWLTRRSPALDEDPWQTHQSEGRIFCITTLALKPEAQGRRLGTHLLNHLLTLATEQGCTEMILETAHAAGFYLRHGFSQLAVREERGIKLVVLNRRL